MLPVSPPSSQKADVRPISFVLDDQVSGSPPVSVDLAIRPEDLSRSDPSRLSVQQTLGGAWGDSFGAGIPTITISGHTGWRRLAGSDQDGMERFQTLKDTIFDQWHLRRRAAVQAGRDPDLVQLIFADALDDFAVVVAPNSFTLRRSRSRPLLKQYQIALTVLSEDIDQLAYLKYGGNYADADILEAAGLDSLIASINEITEAINDVKALIDHTIVAPVKAFMQKTAQLYGAVRAGIAAIDGVASSVISVAQMSAQAGLNIFRTFAAVASIPGQIKARLMQIAGAYSNVWCVLRNALNQQIYYPDYTPMFGSSNCSSTSGGRPLSTLSGQNPFYQVVPTPAPSPVRITQESRASMNVLAKNDVALYPLSVADVGQLTNSVNNGLVIV